MIDDKNQKKENSFSIENFNNFEFNNFNEFEFKNFNEFEFDYDDQFNDQFDHTNNYDVNYDMNYDMNNYHYDMNTINTNTMNTINTNTMNRKFHFKNQNQNEIEKNCNSGFVPIVSLHGPSTVQNVRTHQSSTHLVHISALGSQKFQKIFKFTHFNQMQSDCFTNVFKGNQNIVVSAPTGTLKITFSSSHIGAGKTGVMELAILRLVSLVGVSNTKGISFDTLFIDCTFSFIF